MKKATYQEAKKHEDDAKLKLNEAAKALNDLTVPIEWVNLIDHSVILEWIFLCFVTLNSFILLILGKLIYPWMGPKLQIPTKSKPLVDC